MTLLIIVSIIAFICTIIVGRFTYDEDVRYEKRKTKTPKFEDSNLNSVLYWASGIAISSIAFLATFLILLGVTEGLIASGKLETEVVELSSNEIYALQDKQYIGRRYVDYASYYVTLEEIDEKGMQTKEYNANKSYIKYISPDEQPCVKKITTNIKNKTWYTLYFPPKAEYIFYIPEGSIVEEYNVDLQ